MRRLLFAACIVATLASLGGCASYMNNQSRFVAGREDPFIWFLSGMPAPYDLNWPREPVPELPVLNPPEYVPPPAMQPLDYPRGWNPDHPPLVPFDAGATPDTRDAAPQPTPQPAECQMGCDAPADGTADPARDTMPGADAGALRSGARDASRG